MIKAIYGNVSLLKDYCQFCKCYSFVIDGEFQCCGRIAEQKPITKVKKETLEKPKIEKLTKKQKTKILKDQNYKCFYCGYNLKTTYYMKKNSERVYKLRTHFDHYIPWSYEQNSKIPNMVASCNICNQIKHNKIFDTYIELIKYIEKRKETKGITYV